VARFLGISRKNKEPPNIAALFMSEPKDSAPINRPFLYFVYKDEVVIVNPSDMKIVAVVPV
jgi:hypothetical protein